MGTGTSTLEPSTIEREIIDQVEYYFSDANLFRDKFLRTEIQKNDGWVKLSTLTTFKRLAALSTDLKVIADALEKSEQKLLEISEDRQNVRRRYPLVKKTKEISQEIISRTAYVKGFPAEITISECIAFFKNYPKVSHAQYPNSVIAGLVNPHGSVLVTFNTIEQCAAFLSQDVKYQDKQLTKYWYSDYETKKKMEKLEIRSRTAYIKNFPKKVDEMECTAFFKSFAGVLDVSIHNYLDKLTETYKPSGILHVVFDTVDQCAKFLSQDVKYQERRLTKFWYSGKDPRTEMEKLENRSRQVYVKNFPRDVSETECVEFFKSFPGVFDVLIRSYRDKLPQRYKTSGNLVVVFETVDQCAEFLSQEIEYQGTKVITQLQSDRYAEMTKFWQSKRDERRKSKQKKNKKGFSKMDEETELSKEMENTTHLGVEGIIGKMESDFVFVELKEDDVKSCI